MYLPSPWHATSDCDTSMAPQSCKFNLVVPETPDYKCSPTATANGLVDLEAVPEMLDLHSGSPTTPLFRRRPWTGPCMISGVKKIPMLD